MKLTASDYYAKHNKDVTSEHFHESQMMGSTSRTTTSPIAMYI